MMRWHLSVPNGIQGKKLIFSSSIADPEYWSYRYFRMDVLNIPIVPWNVEWQLNVTPLDYMSWNVISTATCGHHQMVISIILVYRYATLNLNLCSTTVATNLSLSSTSVSELEFLTYDDLITGFSMYHPPWLGQGDCHDENSPPLTLKKAI